MTFVLELLYNFLAFLSIAVFRNVYILCLWQTVAQVKCKHALVFPQIIFYINNYILFGSTVTSCTYFIYFKMATDKTVDSDRT